jgi:hypothetical protein
MPFSQTTTEHTEDYWTNHFNKFLKPIIEENPELAVHRSEPMRGDVLRNIIFNLVQAPIVVADLTDNNPNVYWELGVRQSFKHCTITIAEEGAGKLPFDVSVKGTLIYSPKNHTKMEEFRGSFKKAIEDCLIHPNDSDSHVLESMSGRGSLFELFQRDETIRRLDALLDEIDYNIRELENLINTVNANLKLKKNEKGTYRVTRCLTNSIVLLLSNRYLDQEKSFYDNLGLCLSALNIINGQLGIWEIDGREGGRSVESYLSIRLQDDLTLLQKILELTKKIRSDLINHV